MNYLFIDVETTGLSDNAAVIQIAVVPYVDNEYKEPFMSFVRPHDGCEMSPQAFEVTGIDPKKIWCFPTATSVLDNLLKYIDSFESTYSLAGHNVQFDRRKLFRFFCRNACYGEFTQRFSNRDLCTMKKAKEVFKGKRKKPTSFSLDSLCEYFEIELINSHDALNDINATIKLYQKLEEISPTVSLDVLNMSYHSKRLKYCNLSYYIENPEGDIWISEMATKDPHAMQFILTELWRKYADK
jgi:DNA polymerase-3 subunit epsilon